MKKFSFVAIVAILTVCAHIEGSVERQIANLDKSTENIIKALHLVALKDCATLEEQAYIAAIAQSVFAQAHATTQQLQNQSNASNLLNKKSQEKTLRQEDAWNIREPLDMTNFTLPSFTINELPSPTSTTAAHSPASNKQQSQQRMTLRHRTKK